MWTVFIVWVIFVLACFQAKYVVQFIEFKKRITFSRTIPGPGFKELVENSKKEKVLSWLKELRKRYGKTFRIWFGKDLIVFVTDPDDVKLVLGNNQLLHKSKNYTMLQPWLGKGILTSGGESWHYRRKLLTPAFHFKILSLFKEPMEDCCDILISKLTDISDGRIVDIYPFITLFAMDVICETAMGIKKHAQLNSESDYVKATQSICRILHAQSFSIWQRIPLLFNLSKPGRLRNKYLKILHNETKRVIEMRRKILEKNNIHGMADVETKNDDGEKIRLAFLDMLLLTQNDGGKLTDKNIREEVDTFMFEGHDTTSSAIAFAIYLLSQHKDVQAKAYEESIENENSLESMKYLEAIIKETLRLYPSVPFYSRMVNEPLEIGDITIPKGTGISVLSYLVHRDPKYYPNPEEFKPERFLDSSVAVHHPYAFVAFSAGPRNCIGQKFAMLELKCTLSKLLRAFEFLPVDGFVPMPLAEIVMKCGNGIQVKLRKRIDY